LAGNRGTISSTVGSSSPETSSLAWRNVPTTCSDSELPLASKTKKVTELKFAVDRSTGFEK
jgi:hypothetical protein